MVSPVEAATEAHAPGPTRPSMEYMNFRRWTRRLEWVWQPAKLAALEGVQPRVWGLLMPIILCDACYRFVPARPLVVLIN